MKGQTIYKDYKEDTINLLKGKQYILMSDDLDSYLSTTIVLNHYPSVRIGGFFKPRNANKSKFIVNKGVIALSEEVANNRAHTIGLDVTLTGDIPCISNHVESVLGQSYTPDHSVSCNKHIDKEYTNKSLFSTTLLLWASLGLPLPKDIRGQMILLLVDSTYLGYYAHGGRYKNNIEGYLRAYGLGTLIDVLESKTMEDFKTLASETTHKVGSIGFDNDTIQLHGLGDERVLNDILGVLGLTRAISNIGKFDYIQILDVGYKQNEDFIKWKSSTNDKLVNYARVYNNKVAYTYIRN